MTGGFDERLRRAYNHLYANANIRTPEEIGSEVAKIILAVAYSRSEGLGILDAISKHDAAAVTQGDPDACRSVATRVRAAFSDMNLAYRRYSTSTTIAFDDASVAYVRVQLEGVPLESKSRDWLGDAVEVYRGLAAKRIGGQFFTDQRVTELSVVLLGFDPSRGDDFIDVCGGTGGFLLAALKRLVELGLTADEAAATVHGLEIDPKLRAMGNSTVATLFGPVDEFIQEADSLAAPKDWTAAVRRRVIPGTHRCLASNPPFGTKITIKDGRALAQFELARTWRRSPQGKWLMGDGISPRPPDVLFIERNLQLAEPGRGRVALVTPYQVLSGPQLGFVREWLLRHARLLAVVDLPAETFQPWTGTKTALLVYERRERPLREWNPDEDSHPIFMAIARAIGHDRRGKPVLDDDGAVITDLPAIGEAFECYRRGEVPSVKHPDAFVVDSSAISYANDLRLNAAFYRPQSATARSHLRAARGDAWELTTVGDVSARIFFPTRFKRDYVAAEDGGVPFLSGTNISQLIPTNRKYLSKENPKLSELQVHEGWILVTRSGSTGIVSSVPAEWDGWTMSEHIIRIVADETKIVPGYLEAFLRSSPGQAMLRAGVFGSVIDEITPEYVAEMPIPLPANRELQSRIAERMTEANQARQNAMANIRIAVQTIEDALDG